MSRANPLKEGDVIHISEGHVVYTGIPEHFAYRNRVGVFDKLATREIRIGTKEHGFDTSYLCGKYIVIKEYYDGGSSFMPNGHKVYAKHVKLPIEISFYETGYFTAVNENIEPIGKATLTWSYDD